MSRTPRRRQRRRPTPAAGRQAILANPSGAVFSIWEPRERRGAQLVNEPGAWAMSALNGADLEASKAFYGALFGWQVDTFDVGGAQMTLWTLPGYLGGEPQQPVARDVIAVSPPAGGAGSGAATPHWSVDFWVRDVEEAVARVAQLGGQVIVDPYEVPGVGMRQAVVADSQGATLSLTRPPGLG